MMLILMRIIAQVIDIFVFLFIFVCSFILLLPFLNTHFNEALSAIIILLLVIVICSLLQYPFLKTNQTIGKAFCSLEIVSTNEERPLSVSILVQRELFCKLITCYIICFPVLFGKVGGHEVATETRVIKKIRSRR